MGGPHGVGERLHTKVEEKPQDVDISWQVLSRVDIRIRGSLDYLFPVRQREPWEQGVLVEMSQLVERQGGLGDSLGLEGGWGEPGGKGRVGGRMRRVVGGEEGSGGNTDVG